MSVTHYHSSSRGPVEIASMNGAHPLNAVEKLERSEPHRTDEIAAMRAHLATLEADKPEVQP